MIIRQKRPSIASCLIVVALFTLSLAVAGCGGGGGGSDSSSSSGTTGSESLDTSLTGTLSSAVTCDATKGGELYESKGCAGCHGAIAGLTKLGVTYQRIKDGIANNPGTMSQYSTLTDDEIYDIAYALGDTKGCEKPVACDSTKGGELYDSKGCGSCHGILAASTKTGATYQRIKDGIANNPGTMGQYSTLTDDEIYDIAFALGDTNGCEKPTTSSDADTGASDGTDTGAGDGSGGGDQSGTPSIPDLPGVLPGIPDLPGVGDLTGTLPGAGGTGSLSGVGDLTGSLPGVGDLTGGSLPGVGDLTGSLPGVGDLTGGSLPGVGDLTGALPGVGDLTGSLTK